MKHERERGLAWQENPLFKFFASVQLAMVLLVVLTIASIAGTLYESRFDAKIARAYVYGAAWFNVWLLLLVINLVCSALSRMPWRKRHTGFLITHLGIILVIAGAYIGHRWGIEGTMTLFKGDPPSNSLLVDERVLQIGADGVYPVEMLNHPPTPEHPRKIANVSGYDISAVGYAPLLAVEMEPKPLAAGGVPAVHLSIATAMMGQSLNSWLLADDPAHGVFDMGLAAIHFEKGTAPNLPPVTAEKPEAAKPPAAGEATDIEEVIFAFANTPDQVSRPSKGGPSGAKVKLVDVTAAEPGAVVIEYKGTTQRFDVAGNLGKETAPTGQFPFRVLIKNYWPDFRIQNGEPVSISEAPNNPGVLVMLSGHAVPAGPEPGHDETAPPSMGSVAPGQNSLTVYVDEKGEFSYALSSRKAGKSTGRLAAGEPLTTGWADWKLTVDQYLPHAQEHFNAHPVSADFKGPHTEGLKVRASRGVESSEQWVPLGWQISFPTSGGPLQASYGYRQIPLPISLRLLEFQVDRDEGTDSPAGFKSTVEIMNMEGEPTQGQCWMNNPISYPGNWLRTFTGFTYKISQASWNPENLSQSTVQILRDPGWAFKWIGSLCVVAGVFTLFYLRDPREFGKLDVPGIRKKSGETGNRGNAAAEPSVEAAKA